MKRMHLICTAHVDPIWQWTWDEGISAALATFKSACDLADEFDYIFCHNESLLYEAVEKNCPQLFERIKKLVAKGKWKITGGWYVQPDCLMPSGESFIRQIKTGEKYFMEKFGVKPEIATNFDSFGHSRGLVQILAKNGYKGYIHCRPHVWDNIKYPQGRFWKWTADTGESVIITRQQSYGSVMGKFVEKLDFDMKSAGDIDYCLWGVGNHGGGPSRKDLRDIQNLIESGVPLEHSLPEALFSDDIKIDAEIKQSLVTCMAGCYSSMAKIKQSHREAENLLYSTEKMLAVASLSGYKPDLTALYDAQKRLLLSEFHDVLPGSCIEQGEKEGLELLSACKKVVKDYRTNAFMYLTMNQPVAKEGEFPVYVFNPNPYEVTVPVETEYMLVDQNWSLEFMYQTKVYCGEKQIECQEIKEESTLNLDWRKKVVFNATLKPLGVTRFSIFTEKVKYEEKYVSPAKQANVSEFLKGSALLGELTLETYKDNADPWGMDKEDLRGIGKDPVPFRRMTESECREFIAVEKAIPTEHIIEDGDVYTALEGFYTNGKTNAVIEYKKYKEHDYTDVKVTVEFTEKNKCIKLKIPVPKGVCVGDGPFIIEEKPKDSELTFQKWFGVKNQDGVYAVINDGIYAGKEEDGYLYLTLLRGAGYCMHPLSKDENGGDEKRILYPINRYMPRIDNGRYVFNLRFAKGNQTEITALAEAFNQKPYAVNVFPIGGGVTHPEIKVDKNVCIPTFKIGENGGYIARLYNPSDKPTTANLYIDGKVAVAVDFKRGEIKTVIINGEKVEVISNDTPV